MRFKGLWLSIALAAFLPVGAATPLATQYIAPVSNPDWDHRVLTAEYGTGAGFEYSRLWKGVSPNFYYDYGLKIGGDFFVALSCWVNFGSGASLSAKYTRSVLSPGAPSRRYLYPAACKVTDEAYDFNLPGNVSRTFSPAPGAFDLEYEVQRLGLDAHASTNYSGKTVTAQYVQCVHTDWVYRVSFDPNGGGGTMGVFALTNSAALPANAYARTGYTFTGWNSAPDGSGTSYANLAVVARDIPKLYAQWGVNAYKVALDNQGATSIGTSEVTATYDARLQNITPPSRKGYAFGGYYTGRNGAGFEWYKPNGESSAAAWNIAADTTLYAKWTVDRYRVTFNKQGGSGGDNYVTATYGAAMPTPRKAPKRTGYTFGGYWTSSNGGVQYYDKEMKSVRSWDVASAATLYAKWTSNRYRVTFDKQGGSGGDNYVTATYGAAMPTPRKAPKRTGYTFDGYWNSEDGGGVQYYGKAMNSVRSWDVASVATLYAKWTANKYTVTLGKNGGTGGSSSVSATYGAAMPSVTVPTKAGHTFGGYWTSVLNPAGVKYYNANGTSARTWDRTAAATLWAKWTVNRYRVTFDKQGGSGGDNYVTATYGAAMPTPRKAPKRTGYAFGGYWTSANGGGVQYYNENMKSVRSWNVASAATLYAKWTANKYKVTLGKNGGTGGSSSVSATYGAAMPSVTVPAKAGYTFEGYWTSVLNPNGVKYYNANGTSARTWDKTAASTLWAKWAANACTVRFYANGGSGGPVPDQSFVYDVAANLNPNAYARHGYNFIGWNDRQDGTGRFYADRQCVSNLTETANATVYLYAQWVANTTDVAFDRRGGSGGTESVTATYNSPLPSVAIPSLRGHDFKGYWHAGADGMDSQYYNGDGTGCRTWDVTNEVATLRAEWDARKYVIGCVNTGASGGLESIELTYGKKPLGLTRIPSYGVGYSFKGYFTGEDGTGEKYWDGQGKWVGGDVWTNIEVEVVYAFSMAVAMRVEFDPNGGSCDIADKEVTYGMEYGKLPTPTYAKHEFLGWFTGKSGGSHITADTEVNKTEDHVLYAHWDDKTVPVAFDATGDMPDSMAGNGIIPNDDGDYTFKNHVYTRSGWYEAGKEYGYLPIPTNTNASLLFAGWWSSTDPTNRVQTLEADLVPTNGATLFARWKTKPNETHCTITFKTADLSTSNVTAVVGSEFREYLWSPEYPGGYRHFGWYYQDGRRVDESDVVEGRVKLEGRWTLGVFNDAWGCQDIAFQTNEVGVIKPDPADASTWYEGIISFTGWSIDGEDGVAKSMPLGDNYTEQTAELRLIPDKDGALSFNWNISTVSNEDEGHTKVIFSPPGGLEIEGTIADAGWRHVSVGIDKENTYSLKYWRDSYVDYEGFDDCGWVKDLVFTPDVEPTPIDDWASLIAVTASVSGAVWTTGGAEPWETVAADTAVAAAGAIANGRSSWIRLSVPAGSGRLAFKWRVSGETGYVDTNGVYRLCDYLEFLDDSQAVFRIESVTNDFAEVVYEVTGDSPHVFTWRYVKDVDVVEGEDGAWLKDVVWIPGGDSPQPPLPTDTPTETVVEYEYGQNGEIKRGSVTVPNDWVDKFNLIEVAGVAEGDYLAALTSASGKIGGGGAALPYWVDYVVGTVPTNPASLFRIFANSINDGAVGISWDPDWSDPAGEIVREYTVWGKTNLTDAAWHTPTNSASRFFKVEVSLPRE